MGISVKQLTKVYGTQKAVDDLSFQVRPGEILGFLGPNGAGKSTTMKIATCYLAPTEGTVEVCGYDVQSHPLQVRALLGYLPEHNPLYLDLYVREYLRFAASLHGFKGAQASSRLERMIELVGLGREAHKKIGALSKGYRQRVGLAQALIHDPQVLILDEPTTGLDPNQLAEIREVIRQVGRDKTVMLSTHIMQEVEALCDRVVIVNGGRLVADQDVKSLQRQQTRITVGLLAGQPSAWLAEVPGVNRLEVLGGDRYLLYADADRDTRPEVFAQAVAHGCAIVELHAQEASLEEVFQQITR